MTESPRPRLALAVALLGFFIITLDALVVSVALPAIRESLGGGMNALSWMMDGYTLPFAAFLLLAGTLADRVGARRVFGLGLLLFVISSAFCGLAPSVEWLIGSRFAQGLGAALMTPASLSLIAEAFPEPAARARAVGLWAVGGAVASAAGPLLGGALTAISWRLIFLINLPVGAIAGLLLAGVPPSARRPAAFHVLGQAAAFMVLSALTFGLIEAGDKGLTAPVVVAAVAVSVVSAATLVLVESRAETPMVPTSLFRERPAATSIAVGFTFMVGFFGMVFAMSLYLQEARGLSAVETGLAFMPVTGLSIFAPPLAARFAERAGAWAPIALGQGLMAVGLIGLALGLDASTTTLIGFMMCVGFGGGTAMPSATSLLLNSTPPERSGTASGVLNTSRQVGGALAIAVFGALIAALGYTDGVRLSLGLGGAALITTLVASLRLAPCRPSPTAAPSESRRR